MQSFSRITSGLAAAQAGLYTTGHNISNAGTPGYSRQRVNVADNPYVTLSYNASGPVKLGLGTSIQSITQLRDEFLDKTYRKAVSKANFHEVRSSAINEIENILGELHGDARLSNQINALWSSIHELVSHPDGTETRAMLVSSANAFMTKMNEVSEGLFDYQLSVNSEVVRTVNRINEITTQIEALNKKVSQNEVVGDNANDYRDERNLLIDELSSYGQIEVKENPSGSVTILMEGKDLVSNGGVRLLGLRYTTPGYPFVEPVFNPEYVKDGKILKAGSDARALFTNLASQNMGESYDNDNGSLKALMMVRGTFVANYTSTEGEVNNFTIPKFQRELDILFNKVITLINDKLAPRDYDPANAPYNSDGEQFVELFKRKSTDRYVDDGLGNMIYAEEDPSNPASLYSMGNIIINPVVFNDFDKLCLSQSGDPGDTRTLEGILAAWKGEDGDYLPTFGVNATGMTFDNFYKQLVTNLGEQGNTSRLYVEAQTKIVVDTEASRQQLSGVALDEEITAMMKYQHAYDAAAKMVSIIDSMLQELIRLKG